MDPEIIARKKMVSDWKRHGNCKYLRGWTNCQIGVDLLCWKNSEAINNIMKSIRTVAFFCLFLINFMQIGIDRIKIEM